MAALTICMMSCSICSSKSQSILCKSRKRHEFALYNLRRSRALPPCFSKKKISFADQILDYIEGGPKLRKWYGAPDFVPNDDEQPEEDDENPSDATRDAILVTDGDCEIGQMIILALVVKQARVKAIVKDKRKALAAFGSYVEPISGDLSSGKLMKQTLRNVRAIICPREGFLSYGGSLSGVRHVVLLSQLAVYRNGGGLQSLLNRGAMKLAEEEEARLVGGDVPYTIVRAGALQSVPGGTMGFSFEEGCATKGTLSKEDSAFICVEALGFVPEQGCVFEVANGDESVSDWKQQFTVLTNKKLG